MCSWASRRARTDEGQSVTLTTATFSDNDTAILHSVRVDWGDGSAPVTLDLGPGVTTFSPPAHPYASNGARTPSRPR